METRTEKEKMLAGELYRANDAELERDRLRARRLVKDFNDSSPDEPERRREILRALLGRLGERFEIEPPFYCDYGRHIRVGERFFANFGCTFLDCAPITIGDDVMLGPNVQLYTATHPLDPDERNSGLEQARPILIESGVWIGGGAILLPGITIGEGSSIGAGSIVTKDIPPRVLAAGNPCRVIRALP